MVKGKFKRRVAGFKSGNKMSPKKRKMLQTCSVEEHQPSSSSTTKDTQSAALENDRRQSLRQPHNLPTDTTHLGNFIIDLDLLISKMNQVYFEHQNYAKCK